MKSPIQAANTLLPLLGIFRPALVSASPTPVDILFPRAPIGNCPPVPTGLPGTVQSMILLADSDPQKCNKYYECVKGMPEERQCPVGECFDEG